MAALMDNTRPLYGDFQVTLPISIIEIHATDPDPVLPPDRHQIDYLKWVLRHPLHPNRRSEAQGSPQTIVSVILRWVKFWPVHFHRIRMEVQEEINIEHRKSFIRHQRALARFCNYAQAGEARQARQFQRRAEVAERANAKAIAKARARAKPKAKPVAKPKAMPKPKAKVIGRPKAKARQ